MKKLTDRNLKVLNGLTKEHIKLTNTKMLELNKNIDTLLTIPEKVELKPFFDDYPDTMSFNEIEKEIKQNKEKYNLYNEYISSDYKYLQRNERKKVLKEGLDFYVNEVAKYFGMTKKQVAKFKENSNSFGLMCGLSKNSMLSNISKPFNILRDRFITILSIFNGNDFKFTTSLDDFHNDLFKLRTKEIKRAKKRVVDKKKNMSLNEYIASLPKESLDLPYKDLKKEYELYVYRLNDKFNLENREAVKEFNKELNYRKSVYKRILEVCVRHTNMNMDNTDKLFKKLGLKSEFFNMNSSKYHGDMLRFKRDISNNLELYLK